MDRQDDFYRQVGDREREERKKARKEKWARREKSFWKSFLFTENGKPKSGLIIYTFCLSFVFVGLYIAGFWLVIETVSPRLEGLPILWGNLLQSLLVGAAGCALSALLHLLLPDKRLAFGAHIWLAVYAVACVVTLCVMLGRWEDISAMLVFCGWFVAIPLAMGLVTTWLLFRRDYVPPQQGEAEPEWKKYLRPR